MTRVIRHRCDNCQREAEPYAAAGVEVDEAPADGWWQVSGEWRDGHTSTDHHLCCIDCIVEWGNKQRRAAGVVTQTGTLCTCGNIHLESVHPGVGKWIDREYMERAYRDAQAQRPEPDVPESGMVAVTVGGVEHVRTGPDECSCGVTACRWIVGLLPRPQAQRPEPNR